MVALVATQLDGPAPGIEITPNAGDGLVLVAVANTVKSNRSTPAPFNDHELETSAESKRLGLLFADGHCNMANAVVE